MDNSGEAWIPTVFDRERIHCAVLAKNQLPGFSRLETKDEMGWRLKTVIIP